MISKLIENGNVFVFDKIAQKSYKCKAGDEISVNVPKPRVLETKAENIPLDIVYEDGDLLVVNKPKEWLFTLLPVIMRARLLMHFYIIAATA